MSKKMFETSRRNMLRAGLAFVAMPGTAILNFGCTPDQDGASLNTEDSPDDPSNGDMNNADKGDEMQIQYLEVVTPDVDAICATYSQIHGVTFGESDPNLGGARTAKLANGGLLGVRAPMRDTEEPVVRPYWLVDNIQESVAAAADSGAEIALPPTEIPGNGSFAIIIQGGIQTGFWQL